MAEGQVAAWLKVQVAVAKGADRGMAEGAGSGVAEDAGRSG